MNLEKFNFDFDKTYKELRSKVLKNKDLHTGLYHYLQTTDRFHDVLEKVIKYLEQDKIINHNYFISIFWKAWGFSNLQNYDKNNKKVTNSKLVTYIDQFDTNFKDNHFGVSYQPDFDQVQLLIKIRNCPTVNNIMEGYSVKELSEAENTYEMAYRRRYHKELKKLI